MALCQLKFCTCILFLVVHVRWGNAGVDYKTALSKSILFFEAQRSGVLPKNQRVTWRGNSGLQDGNDAGIDLVGGYYDAGDNVKFSFPMAYAVTMLSWAAIEFENKLSENGELNNAMAAVRWGTDYFLKAHIEPEILYGEVGDGNSDHSCWMRPEDMTTPRTSYRIDRNHPGSDLAGEVSACLAAASIVFKNEPQYSAELLSHARQLFDFARTSPGVYQNSISVASQFYSSSGYQDELLWAAAWLHRATGDGVYLNYIENSGNTGGFRSTFSWDDKFLGVQTLVAKLVMDGNVPNHGIWAQYMSNIEEHICSLAQKGNNNFQKSPGGYLWFGQPWSPIQYTASSMFLASAYSSYLFHHGVDIRCSDSFLQPNDLVHLVKSQVDYILGANPKGMSYMVGFGNNYPQQAHHRGASIVSIKSNPTHVICQEGFNQWFHRTAPNPNILDGAFVGGPDNNDNYSDSRSNFQQAEPSVALQAPIVGVLAWLA